MRLIWNTSYPGFRISVIKQTVFASDRSNRCTSRDAPRLSELPVLESFNIGIMIHLCLVLFSSFKQFFNYNGEITRNLLSNIESRYGIPHLQHGPLHMAKWYIESGLKNSKSRKCGSPSIYDLPFGLKCCGIQYTYFN